MAKVGRKEEARRWISQAIFDLKGAEWNLKGEFFNTACFLAQQASEKGLKSLLYYGGAGRQRIISHSIVELISEAKRIIPSMQDLINEARELDLHYIPSRDPNALPGGFPHTFYGEETAKKTLECSQKRVQVILVYYDNQDFELDYK